MTPNQMISTLRKTLVLILGGGRGERLYPLTANRAKPAVPIGGNFRLISGPISNAVNSGLGRISVVTQYEPTSLERAIRNLSAAIAPGRNEFIGVLSPRIVGTTPQFFLSDGHCLIRLHDAIASSEAKIIIVAMADQLMKINMIEPLLAMLESGAHAAFVYKKVCASEAAGNLGVLEIGKNQNVIGMEEKPDRPQEISGQPGFCYANLALYVFEAASFFAMLQHMDSCHDPDEPLSKTGIPWMIQAGAVGYDLAANPVPGATEREAQYFEDLGTLDRYFKTAMSTCQTNPPFNFYSRDWPILSPAQQPQSPAKADSAILQSVLLAPNVIVQHGVRLSSCVVSNGQRIGEGSALEECVLLGGARGWVGAGCNLKKVVVDKDTTIPDGTILGPDHLPPGTMRFRDVAQALKNAIPVPTPPILSDNGVLFIPKGYRFSYPTE